MTGGTLLYLVGAPGVGKSTLMAALTDSCRREAQARPVRHDLLLDDAGNLLGAELGARRPRYAGTDALPMHANPYACAWLREGNAPPLVLGEGDRLANQGFLTAADDGGYAVWCVLLSLPADALERRHAGRGAKQDAAWRAGRATKAERLARWATTYHRCVSLDATQPAEAMARYLRQLVPALAVLP